MKLHVPIKITANNAHAALIHTALLLFGCDLIGQVYLPFHTWWEDKAHFLVALAAFLATFGEATMVYVHATNAATMLLAKKPEASHDDA